MNTYYTYFHSLLGASLGAWILDSAPIAAAELDAEVSTIVTQVDAIRPGLGNELRRLALQSLSARQLLESYFAKAVQRPENHPKSADSLVQLWKWGGIAVAAFDHESGDFESLKKHWPEITRQGRLICAMADEQGHSHLLYTPLGWEYHPKNPMEEISVYDLFGNQGGIYQTQAQSFAIEKSDGRDILVLKEKWRGDFDTLKQAVHTQKVRLTKDFTFEELEDKTELVAWKPEDDAPAPAASNPTPPIPPGGVPKTPTTQPETLPPVSPTVPESEQQQHPTHWPYWLIAIGAAVGLLWWTLKKRK